MRRQAVLDHFIHILWPSPHYLERVMPETLRRELLTSLLHNDVLGFQTIGYCENFMAAGRSFLRATIDFANGIVTYRGHDTLVQAYPISVDVGQFRRMAAAGEDGDSALGDVLGLRRKVGRRMLGPVAEVGP